MSLKVFEFDAPEYCGVVAQNSLEAFVVAWEELCWDGDSFISDEDHDEFTDEEWDDPEYWYRNFRESYVMKVRDPSFKIAVTYIDGAPSGLQPKEDCEGKVEMTAQQWCEYYGAPAIVWREI